MNAIKPEGVRLSEAVVGAVLVNHTRGGTFKTDSGVTVTNLVRVTGLFEDGRRRITNCAERCHTKVGEKTLAINYRLATPEERLEAMDLERARGPY